ncbi:ATP-dependent zinc protease [Rosistilla oblonga]|uniref:ATP-dependent zinc protease family protein n=1 Tax=Rosistilla oblonga TaxID=2527990 RepID=UPI003A97C113
MQRTDDTPQQPVIGWREWVSLPELGIGRIKAKVDTGARSSSLHAIDIVEQVRDGVTYLQFKVLPAQRKERFVEVSAKLLEYRHVRSSSGKASSRPVILTDVGILGQRWPIELTLANRKSMGFRMLLGREAFRGRMLVDAGKSYYGGKPKRRPPSR